VPPANKPTPDERAHCRPYLEREIELLAPKVIVCLGRLAFSGVLKIHGCRESDFDFAHGATHLIPGTRHASQRWLVCSYHPSQQNTLTGKLTVAMFDRIWITARQLAQHDHP
jgi:uracil-DNA glycosylase family 4